MARPIGAPIRGPRLEDGWEITIADLATTWYLVRLVRSVEGADAQYGR